MNLNAGIDLKNIKFDPTAVLKVLKRVQPALVGIVLVSVFAYTAYAVNAALNTPPIAAPATPLGVSFNKTTLNSLKTLSSVPSSLPTPALGASDPFGSN